MDWWLLAIGASVLAILVLGAALWAGGRAGRGRAVLGDGTVAIRGSQRGSIWVLRPLDAIGEALASVVPGRVAFDPPADMRQGKVEKVSVALIRARGLDEALRAHLRETGAIEFVDIPTAPLMAVRLLGEAFEIRPLSEEEQPVGTAEATSWEFYLRGLRPGSQTITVVVSMRLLAPGREDVRRSVPVLERSIRIRVAPLYAGQLFVRQHGKWLIGTAIAVGAMGTGVAAWLKLL